MTAAEVETVVANHEGRLCARMYRRSDGTLLTQDCPVGLRAILRQKVRRVSQVAGAALSAAMSVSFASAQAVTPPTQNRSSLVQIDSQGTRITVVVKDELGAVIPGADVLVVSERTRQKAVGVTDGNGRFSCSHLLDGPYTVTVSRLGFAASTFSHVDATNHSLGILPVTLHVATVIMGYVVELNGPEPQASTVNDLILPRSGTRDTQAQSPSQIAHRRSLREFFSSVGRRLGF